MYLHVNLMPRIANLYMLLGEISNILRHERQADRWTDQ